MTALPSPWRRFVESRLAPWLLLAVFALLIVTTINRFSIWIDESSTLELERLFGYAELVRRVQYDVHPPLWYLVLKPWLQLFGGSIVAARAQSAVFMVVALAVWYRFVRTRFSRPLALFALLLMVTNPMLLHYAVEGRMYAFGVLLTAVSSTLVTSRRRRWWLAYWPCAVVMLYTHYFLAFVLAAQFVYLFAARRDHGVSVLWLIAYGASIIAPLLPWLPHAIHTTTAVVTNGFWIPPVVPSTALGYVLHAFLHCTDGDLSGIRVFPTLVYLAAWGVSLVRAARVRGGPMRLLWCLAGVPWLFLFALSCKPLVPVFHARYVVFGLPALITLLAAGARALAGRWRTAAIAILVVGHVLGLRMLRAQGFDNTRGYFAMKAIAREIGKPIGGELPVVVSAWLFPFMDARATLPDEQRVIELRGSPPHPTAIPDSLYYDRPDWYVLSLADVHARHVWFLEDAAAPPREVPPSWHLEVTHRRGYARARLFLLPAP